MIDGGIITGALIAGALAGGASYFGQQSANAANRELAGAANATSAAIADADRRDNLTYFKAQQDFQEIMSNTAYRRAMADMRLAGLNPILAADRGGATTPSGGSRPQTNMPHMEVPTMQNALGPAVSSAMQSANAIMGIQKTAADIDQVQAATKLHEADAHRSNMQAGLAAAETATTQQREQLNRTLVQTEIERQAQLRAESALASARTATEYDVRERHRGETAAAIARANRDSVEAAQRERYGPPGRISSTVGGASQSLESIVNGNNPLIRRFMESVR